MSGSDPTSVTGSPKLPVPSAGDEDLTPIKGNVKRSVFRERSPNARDRIVKIFHAPGLGKLRDRARAAGEAKRMRAARAAGLPVPEVHGVARVDGHWRLSASPIEDAKPLDDWLLARSRGARLPLARALGELLGTAQDVGFVHADPHPGNVLVDGRGKLWLVDLAGSRLRRPLSSVVESFARGAGALREMDRRFLGAVYGNWRRAASRRGLGPIPGARALDLSAQQHRLAATNRRLRVWKRESTPTCLAEEEGRLTVRVRVQEAPPDHWEIRRAAFDSEAAGERAWDHLVRARLHRLPAARPISTALAPPWRLEFAVPPGASCAEEPPCDRLAALLLHRGLQVAGPLLRDADGSTLIGPNSVLSRRVSP